MLTDGKHIGRAKGIEIGETRQGKPQVIIPFEIDDGEKKVTMHWFGSLNAGAARTITLKAVCAAGLDQYVGSLQQGAPVKDITGKDVSLVLATEEYNGKHTLKIKWVNNLQRESLSQNEVRGVLQGIDLAGEIKAIKMSESEWEQPTGFAPNDEMTF